MNILIVVAVVTSFFIGRAYSPNPYLKIEAEISTKLKNNPTKYKDYFSFGYQVGLLDCSSIVHRVLKK
jgi:hypothetical protein